MCAHTLTCAHTRAHGRAHLHMSSDTWAHRCAHAHTHVCTMARTPAHEFTDRWICTHTLECARTLTRCDPARGLGEPVSLRQARPSLPPEQGEEEAVAAAAGSANAQGRAPTAETHRGPALPAGPWGETPFDAWLVTPPPWRDLLVLLSCGAGTRARVTADVSLGVGPHAWVPALGAGPQQPHALIVAQVRPPGRDSALGSQCESCGPRPPPKACRAFCPGGADLLRCRCLPGPLTGPGVRVPVAGAGGSSWGARLPDPGQCPLRPLTSAPVSTPWALGSEAAFS